jgi:plasmid stabilization system protein ParE
MTRALRSKREAEIDIAETFDWYEARSEGLGGDFLRAVDAVLANIQRNPFAYQVIGRAVRHANLRRFPYSVFFTVRESDIVVIGCLHQSRDPAIWQKRSP